MQVLITKYGRKRQGKMLSLFRNDLLGYEHDIFVSMLYSRSKKRWRNSQRTDRNTTEQYTIPMDNYYGDPHCADMPYGSASKKIQSLRENEVR